MRLSTGLLALVAACLTCSAALAGDLKCHVTMGGTDVGGAKLVPSRCRRQEEQPSTWP